MPEQPNDLHPSPKCPCDVCALVRHTLRTFATDDPLQRRADEIAAADRAEEANQFFAASLCYSGTPGGRFGGFDGSGVHLTLNGRTTLCGRPVLDEPTVPRTIGPLSCEACYGADHAR